MADLENGLWGESRPACRRCSQLDNARCCYASPPPPLAAGNLRQNLNNTPLTSDFVTAMVKGGTNGFALKGGDATQGGLITQYDGPRPNGYQPMKKQGSIILGIGGDNSDWAIVSG